MTVIHPELAREDIVTTILKAGESTGSILQLAIAPSTSPILDRAENWPIRLHDEGCGSPLFAASRARCPSPR